VALFLAVSSSQPRAQEEMPVTIKAPDFEAQLSGSFNYDLLRDPTAVSFKEPRGYLSINIPLTQGLPPFLAEDIAEGLSGQIAEGDNGEQFRPVASAGQYAATTIMVDVPMLGGVASFSNVQNMFLRYANTLGAPQMTIPMEEENFELFMRGAVAVPLRLSMGWETMTFGYAYEVNERFRLALNLHRHLFRFDLRGKVDIDLLGQLTMKFPEAEEAGASDQLASANPLMNAKPQQIDYPSDSVYGVAEGHYDLTWWTPTIGAKYWRFSLTSRFGMDTRPKGQLFASYALPILLDARTFQPLEYEELLDKQEAIRNNETVDLAYGTKEDMIWRMPSGHTLAFELIRNHMQLSYTKLFGEIQMKINGLREITTSEDGAVADTTTIPFDVAVKVDHVLLLNTQLFGGFINLGVFGIDVRFLEQENLLSKIEGLPHYGGGVLMPILSFGSTVGQRMKLHLEADILPLPALKSGIVYRF
jgi:hypothetical protein